MAPLQTGDFVRGGRREPRAIDRPCSSTPARATLIWSGWPNHRPGPAGPLHRADRQPTRLGGTGSCSARRRARWERSRRPRQSGLAEAPQVLQRRTDLPGLLLRRLLAADVQDGMLESGRRRPARPGNWLRHPNPVFQSSGTTYGVGHSIFVTSPTSGVVAIFHAKLDPDPGWRRALFAQPMRWRSDGTPSSVSRCRPAAPVPVPAAHRGGDQDRAELAVRF